ncbi:ZP3 protein, partial [Amia calva]|nr:ZP3 protein [Amia calva]
MVKSSFYQLRGIAKLKGFLSFKDMEMVILAFMSSRLDYCNSLYLGLSKKLLLCMQLVQNADARLLTGTKKHSSITPVLASLHWLPDDFRVQYKVLLMVQQVARSLRSSQSLLLNVPQSKLKTIINGRLVYSNILRYSPPRSSGPVLRGVSFTVPIQLVYNRFHYSYKIGYQPTFPQHGSTLPGMDKSAFFRELKNRHGYILVTTNEQWIRLSPKNIYYLGQPMYFQATGYFATEGQRLFIQSCYATASPDRHSKPRFTVIDNFGCLVDSKADGCQSRFVPYMRKDVLRFTIDAFLFQKTLSEHGMTDLYMHCTMTVAEHVTPGTKSCTYNRKAKRWEELYGNHAVCVCCDSRCAGDRAEGGYTGAMNLASFDLKVRLLAVPLYTRVL